MPSFAAWRGTASAEREPDEATALPHRPCRIELWEDRGCDLAQRTPWHRGDARRVRPRGPDDRRHLGEGRARGKGRFAPARRQGCRYRSRPQRPQLHRPRLHRPPHLERARRGGVRHDRHRNRRRLHRGAVQLQRRRVPGRRPARRGRHGRPHAHDQRRRRPVRHPALRAHQPRARERRDRHPPTAGPRTVAALRSSSRSPTGPTIA